MIAQTSRLQCCLLAAALAALSVSAASATIYPGKAIGGYFQQTTTTRSIHPPTSTGCSNTFGCYFVFDLVPRDKQLVVTHISCLVTVEQGGVRHATLALLDRQLTLVTRYQYGQPIATGNATFVLNTPTLALFDSSERPLLFVQGTVATSFSGTCNIAGQLLDPR